MTRRDVVASLRYEPVDHLAFDTTTTLCGQPWEARVLSGPRPICDECTRAVTP